MIAPVRFPFVLTFAMAMAVPVSAHDLERTTVTLTFARDGSFILDVANDPDWLLLRLEPFAGVDTVETTVAVGTAGLETRTTTDVVQTFRPAVDRDARLAALGRVFIDRVVLFVDGHEVRAASAEYVPPPPAAADAPRAIYRLRGRMPPEAHTLRWYYGLVIDPYPLTIRRADARSITEWIRGDAWSGPLDLSGQFQTRRETGWLVLVVALFVVGLTIRVVLVAAEGRHG